MSDLLVIPALLLSLAVAACTDGEGNQQEPGPTLANPVGFDIELYAVFDESLDGGIADDAFHMTLLDDSHGFPPGLYVTGGPGSEDRLFLVEGAGEVSVFSQGFGSEALVLAQGDYGEGMLITEPRRLRIVRLLPDGEISTFADLGTEPFGPAGIAYGPDNRLYVSDFTAGNLLRVLPDGSSEVFASVLLPETDAGMIVVGMKNAIAITESRAQLYGGDFVVSIFTFDLEARGSGSVHLLSSDGAHVREMTGGVDGLEFITEGPGGIWGDDLYVASIGAPGGHENGAVYTLKPDGTLIEFLSDISAVHVVFDTEGVLGGGMFITEIDLSEDAGPARIWRVTSSSG